MAGSHVFICFSSKDEAVAREVVNALEADGLNCWISTRDVLAGQNYQETIVRALEAASAIIFLFSENSNTSQEIRKELSIGGSIRVPVFPLRLSPVEPSGALRYELAIRQWIDLYPDQQQALRRLADIVKGVINAPPADGGIAPNDRPPAANLRTSPKGGTAPPLMPLVAPGSRQFEAVRTLLARHIGPIARVFVERAAGQARTQDEFCEQLAAHVPAPADRAAFVRALREQLGKT